jgi:hypothetical protein
MHLLTRTRTTIVLALIATLGLSGLAMSSDRDSGAKKRTTKHSCTLKTVDLNPSAINGEDYGTLKCSRPFGRGVQHNQWVLKPETATTGKLDGHSTLYFNRGTARAKFLLDYEISGSTIHYYGDAEVTGGTGAFKGITGKAKLDGVSHDSGTHGTMTEKVKVQLP